MWPYNDSNFGRGRTDTTHEFAMKTNIFANIFVSVIGFSALAASIDIYCPNNNVCNCTSESITCVCLQREDVVFIEDEGYTGKQIIIKGCGKVELKKLSLKNLQTELVHISDLLELQIEPYAFGDSCIRNVHIYNISVFELEPYGLGNIKNVSNLIISNVTFENMHPVVLGDTAAQNVSITNSHIGTIMSRSLHLQNVENFLMENNFINALDLTCIQIKNISKFNFTRNSVVSTSFGSISLTMAKVVDVGHCSFRYVHSSMIITKDIEVFALHDCNIENTKERAFWSIQAKKEIRFVKNRISLAEDDSLLPNLGPNAIDFNILISKDNQFSCDCEIEWLLTGSNSDYDLIKGNNVCYEPPHLSDLKLSQLTLSLDRMGTCISVEASTTPARPTSTHTTTEIKLSSQTPATVSSVSVSYTQSHPFSAQKTTSASTQSNKKEESSPQHSSADTNIYTTFLSSSLFFFTLWWIHTNAYLV